MTERLKDIQAADKWGIFPPGTGRLMIAGPCSAESLPQVLDSARAVKELGIEVFRAGLWKQRTHPGTFEGVGELGLEWLLEAKKRFGIAVSTEVSSPEQAHACIEAGLDMIWIGARTTANPQLVQSIAEALKGSDIPVLVKNPVNQDLDLWIGALERLDSCGLKKLGAVHRGFSTFDRIAYRNEPLWQAAVALKTRFPNLPVICDPSHMAGNSELVPELALKAMNLGLDGLMVEVHCCPGKALSDSSQQLDPDEFGSLLQTLGESAQSGICPDGMLSELRARLDDIDSGIVSLLSERMEVCAQIGELKRCRNLPVIQMARWSQVISGILHQADLAGLDAGMVKKIFDTIHETSVAVQNDSRD